MTSRYSTTRIGINDSPEYENILKERGVKRIEQYFTPKMRYLTAEEINSLNVVAHIWTTGDRFYKLAHDYYNDARLWWLIAWFNRTPTEADLSLGDMVNIPLPADRVIELLGL